MMCWLDWHGDGDDVDGDGDDGDGDGDGVVDGNVDVLICADIPWTR